MLQHDTLEITVVLHLCNSILDSRQRRKFFCKNHFVALGFNRFAAFLAQAFQALWTSR